MLKRLRAKLFAVLAVPLLTCAHAQQPSPQPAQPAPQPAQPSSQPGQASQPAQQPAPPATSERQNAERANAERPAAERPGTERPAERPTGERPTGERPAGERPAAQRPAAQRAPVHAAAQKPAQARPQPAREPFNFAVLQRIAQDRASRPYRERSPKLPQVLAQLGYDQYRDIRFRRTSALWYDHAMFEVQFFHRGFTYDRKVNISEIVGSAVRAVPYNPAMFEFGKLVPPVKLPAELGFAGFRIHYPLNTPAYKDEVLVFLGASYFRVLGRNQTYGMSARGLAINTATEGGEEFPYFTDFWLVRPEPEDRSMTIYALLDSPSVTGAYQFELRPGSLTQVQVSGELYPRRAIEKIGIGALTSMYLYGENYTGRHFDDFRPEVHDSDGLMTQTGTGEWAWRPLVNPHSLRVNRFMDQHPRGFGLIQRDRDPTHYQDAEARFELRPSYWVEPLGDWGKGGVELVEIPSDEEIHDNMVAYWVPEAPVQPRKAIAFSYLLYAYSRSSRWPPGGRVISTRIGAVFSGANAQAAPGLRRMVIDFAGGDLDDLYAAQPVRAQITSSGGEVDAVTVERVPQSAIWRVAFKLKPAGDRPVDLRCYLTLYGEALTETWTYLWKPPGGT
ncbi:MAG TPA: glucan biosynthesis protein [Steroidobacteraceae bacterium]|nr:glucan biosynthesis protein [Steroidobacteraceae bacterium]